MQIAAWTAASRPRPALQGHRRPARKSVLIGGAGVIGSRNHPPDLPASKAGKGRGRALGRAEAARRLAAGLEVGNPPKPQRYDARHQHHGEHQDDEQLPVFEARNRAVVSAIRARGTSWLSRRCQRPASIFVQGQPYPPEQWISVAPERADHRPRICHLAKALCLRPVIASDCGWQQKGSAAV